MNPIIWTSNGIDKIKQDSLPKNNICLTRDLYLPNHGCDSFQISITTDQELKDISFKTNGENEGIKVDIFREEIIEMADAYPDPIYPQISNISLGCGTTTFLVKFSAEGLKSGFSSKYTIDVMIGEEKLQTITVNLTVWNFSLPEKPYCDTAVALYRECMRHKHRDSKVDGQTLYIRYYEMLQNYKISAYDIPYDVLDPRADEYMDKDSVTAFRIPYSQDDETLKKYYYKLSQKESWLKKAYFYPLDEPKLVEHIDALKQISKRLEKLFPGARLCVPFFLDIKYNENEDQVAGMEGSVNLWCPKTYMYNGTVLYNCEQRAKYKPFSERIADRQKLGDEVWWYVCWEPGNPYCNLFVNQEGIQHRLLFWQQKIYNVHGFLYWGANEWNGVIDPWTDMATVKGLSPDVYGDGSLMYNGNKIGIDGPCASLRLEDILYGIEDFDILNIAEELFGHEYITEMINKITTSVVDYTMDSNLLISVRNEIGQKISDNNK